jgi:putative NADH-flavin reductase
MWRSSSARSVRTTDLSPGCSTNRQMKVTVLGATGKTGRHVVKQALNERGHEVVAFVRDPARLDIRHPALTIVQGDLIDARRVEEAIAGSDAVVSAAGQTKTSPKDLLTVTARHLVPAMEKHGVRRIISLIGAGVLDERDPTSFGRRFMHGLMKVVARDLLEDATRHADILRATDLEWVLVRPPRLTDGPRTGATRVGYFALGPRDSITRADLATFMLDAAASDEHVRAAPMVAS